MVNKDKIRLMTDLALFERKNRNTVLKVNGYYRYDYYIWNLLLAFFRYTLCFLFLFVLYLALKYDELFYNINLNGILESLKPIGNKYLMGLCIYLLIALLISIYRYRKAGKGILQYEAMLTRFSRRYG